MRRSKVIKRKQEQGVIYFDNNSTEPLYPEVCDEIYETLKTCFGNPSTSYSVGRRAKEVLQKAREKVQKLLHIKSYHQIKFTSCASESNVLVTRGRVALIQEEQKANRAKVADRFVPHVVSTQIEHASVTETLRDLEQAGCCELTLLPVEKRTGRLDPEVLRKCLTPRTILVSIIAGNNEIGTVQDLKGIVRVVDEYRRQHKASPLLLHFDMTQVIGRVEVDLNRLGVDAVTFGSHKFGGPRFGCLFIRDPSSIHSLMTGGSQEEGFRAGTENIPYAVGMAAALGRSLKDWKVKRAHILRMRDYLKTEMIKLGGRVNGDQKSFLINTLSVSFTNADGKRLMKCLDEYGVCLNVGSACSKGARSKTLEAIQLTQAEEQGTIRVSLSPSNTIEQCKYFVSVLDKLMGDEKKLTTRRVARAW